MKGLVEGRGGTGDYAIVLVVNECSDVVVVTDRLC